jgi:hypothetical protein
LVIVSSVAEPGERISMTNSGAQRTRLPSFARRASCLVEEEDVGLDDIAARQHHVERRVEIRSARLGLTNFIEREDVPRRGLDVRRLAMVT